LQGYKKKKKKKKTKNVFILKKIRFSLASLPPIGKDVQIKSIYLFTHKSQLGFRLCYDEFSMNCTLALQGKQLFLEMVKCGLGCLITN
jgi:hypothetical protein